MKKPKPAKIVSFPRSGRTWLRVMLGKACCDLMGVDDRYLISPSKSGKRSRPYSLPRFAHCGTDKGGMESLKRYSSKNPEKIILLVRNPWAVVRSYKKYLLSHPRQNLRKQGDISVSEFIRSKKYGLEKVVTFYNNWFEDQDKPDEFMVITYEDMKADPATTLREIVDFLEWPDVPDSVIADAVEFSSLENMKKMENEGYLKGFPVRKVTWAVNSSRGGAVSVGVPHKEVRLSRKDRRYVNAKTDKVKWDFWKES